ncbi:MAG: DUF1684 domain-containing protein [Bacteroidales bacterium]|nr:DUF1684 domain-containing protein [Bacteroidales bacterium]
MDTDRYAALIQEERIRKDMFFIHDNNSPITFEQRLLFEGLSYYPPNPDLRFELELIRHKVQKVLKINDTKGNLREFIRWGEFRFMINGENCTLQAYKNHSEEERLFVPFRDKTSGNETYGAGRYIDLDYEEHRTKEGKWILDFNKAYNPWCAYSEHYACPYIDPENWLGVPVRAGEKNYPAEKT